MKNVNLEDIYSFFDSFKGSIARGEVKNLIVLWADNSTHVQFRYLPCEDFMKTEILAGGLAMLQHRICGKLWEQSDAKDVETEEMKKNLTTQEKE